MRGRRVFPMLVGILLAGVFSVGAVKGEGARHLRIADGDIAFTLLGQVTSNPPQSIQYGYLPTITGLEGLFSSSDENEATALFTFVNDTQTTAVRHSGTITVIERVGTTTIYIQSSPHGSFADPESFRGDAILVMSLKQQVIFDANSGLFTAIMSERVTDSNVFQKDGQKYVLARKGDQFRIGFSGAFAETPPPTGFLAGYAVRIGAAIGGQDRD